MFETLFERVNLGAISEMLLYNSMPEAYAISTEECDKKVKANEKELQKQLDSLGLELNLSEKLLEIIYEHKAKTNPVYFELGMKAGASFYRKLQEN